jgi:hypothetical protein
LREPDFYPKPATATCPTCPPLGFRSYLLAPATADWS